MIRDTIQQKAYIIWYIQRKWHLTVRLMLGICEELLMGSFMGLNHGSMGGNIDLGSPNHWQHWHANGSLHGAVVGCTPTPPIKKLSYQMFLLQLTADSLLFGSIWFGLRMVQITTCARVHGRLTKHFSARCQRLFRYSFL